MYYHSIETQHLYNENCHWPEWFLCAIRDKKISIDMILFCVFTRPGPYQAQNESSLNICFPFESFQKRNWFFDLFIIRWFASHLFASTSRRLSQLLSYSGAKRHQIYAIHKVSTSSTCLFKWFQLMAYTFINDNFIECVKFNWWLIHLSHVFFCCCYCCWMGNYNVVVEWSFFSSSPRYHFGI